MQSNLVRWLEIYVQDMDRAKSFYVSVFQVKLEKLNTPEPDIQIFPMMKDKMGASSALVKMDGEQRGSDHSK